MNVNIDLSGGDQQDDLAYIRDAYQAIESITCGDSHKHPQLHHVSNLLSLINHLHQTLLAHD